MRGVAHDGHGALTELLDAHRLREPGDRLKERRVLRIALERALHPRHAALDCLVDRQTIIDGHEMPADARHAARAHGARQGEVVVEMLVRRS